MIYYKDMGIHIFDCDGVILDTNHAKVEAIKQTLNMIISPAIIVSNCVESFRVNFGQTRSEHFKRFADIFFKHGRQDLLLKLAEAESIYTQKVQDLYIRSSVVKETNRYIKALNWESKLYVVSASNQADLRNVLKKKVEYFSEKNIFGGPTSKVKNISNILKLNDPRKTVLYGDSVPDAMAALTTGIGFVGLMKYSADPVGLSEFCSQNDLFCKSTLS
jgi:beta-phosphoglucomutase-like phosphatase (HAD superfamily)